MAPYPINLQVAIAALLINSWIIIIYEFINYNSIFIFIKVDTEEEEGDEEEEKDSPAPKDSVSTEFNDNKKYTMSKPILPKLCS